MSDLTMLNPLLESFNFKTKPELFQLQGMNRTVELVFRFSYEVNSMDKILKPPFVEKIKEDINSLVTENEIFKSTVTQHNRVDKAQKEEIVVLKNQVDQLISQITRIQKSIEAKRNKQNDETQKESAGSNHIDGSDC